MWIFVWFCLSTAVSAQPAAKADIEASSTKIANLETTANKIDQRLTAVEKTTNDIDKRLIRLETKVDEMDKRLTARIDLLFWAMGSLIAVVLAVIALPQVLGYLQGKREEQTSRNRLTNSANRSSYSGKKSKRSNPGESSRLLN
jgi:hypothetical protein